MRTIQTIALVVSLLPSAALANGYSVPNVSPRDLALSSSAVAAQRDAGAVYANPAALARLEGLNLALALPVLDIAATWNAPVGPASDDTQLKLVPPAAAFASYGGAVMGHRYGVGLGFNVPYGGNVFWDSDWAGRFRVVTVDRKVYAGYLNGGVEVLPFLRVGGGLLYYYTTEYLVQGLDFLGSEGNAELSAKGGALAYQVALEVEPFRSLRVGVNYKHKATQTLEGDAAFHGVPDALRPLLPDQDVKHVLTIPNVFEVAVAWQARQDLLFTACYSFDRYRVYDQDLFEGSAGTQVLVPRDYGNGYVVRLGAEYRLSPRLELRAGGQRDVSGMKSENFSPSLPDASSWAGSVGASWHFSPDLALHAALFVAIMDRVTATGDAFPGSYDIRAEIFSIGATWRPPIR